ncbi:MAG: ATP-dependent RNA helicase HrpA [Phycisphaerales bacterium JB059]
MARDRIAIPDDLARQIERALPADRGRLRARVRGMLRRGEATSIRRAIERDIETSATLWRRRRDLAPSVTYPEELPISQRRDEISAAIRDHQVVVLCGETGSGKTTQLPKICLDLGRGVDRTIGHTQPRRIAARSVAARVAEELKVELGGVVGYKVRFGDQASPESLVKLMTDGILLAETQGDRHLNQYDTIIIDEAHERSLNIDFLLGYLRNLLPRRPDLKVIVTSATIDPERFAQHFDLGSGPAPIIEVSGRTYPVDVRYRPLLDPEAVTEETPDLYDAVGRAIDECERDCPGDVLVFMPGEREIRETAEALRKRYLGQGGTEILPLYARLSPQDQQRVFRAHRGRRVVIATNVAETSLTVPGIRAVVDPGTARLSRYSARSKVQGLEIEPISQASANQRAGRCGRVAPGVCVRLFSEEDFKARDAFTPPEILRTNLASVVLQMAALRLGRPEDFPFVEQPDARLIRDGYETLRELGAITDENELTPIGREMARLPIDPRIARMILAARDEDCVREVLIIASALASQDPRDRPMDKRDQADAAHERFRDERSDFLEYLKIWEFYHAQSKSLSRSKLEKACRQNFLSVRRLGEWREVYRQVRALALDMGAQPKHADADYDRIHRALLTGLLTSVGKKGDGFEYEGVRGGRFHIFPGSGQFEAKPKWIMSAEIVRTTRTYARCVARIEPEWIESVGSALVKRTHSEPHWDERTARVLAFEKVTLLGLEVIPRKRVHYGPIDPASSRELFIHHALVEGEYASRSRTLAHNRALVSELQELEERARRRDILGDAQARYAFYDKRLPRDVYSGQTFERWLKKTEAKDRDVIRMTREDLVIGDPRDASPERFPDAIEVDGRALELDYLYQPGDARDGTTLQIPVESLGQVRREQTDWVVPGLREEKIAAMIRSLPKPLRRPFDAQAVARELAATLTPGARTMSEEVAEALGRRAGVSIRPEDFRLDQLDPHLTMNYRVVDESGKTLGEGRDLGRLKQELGVKVRAGFAAAAGDTFRRDDLTDWDLDELPESVEVSRDGRTLRGYPALADLDGRVCLRLYETKESATRAMRRGLARLYVHHLRDEMKYRESHLPGIDRLSMLYAPIGPGEQLRSDLMLVIAGRAFVGARPWVRTREAFVERVDDGWNAIGNAVDEVCTVADAILALGNEVAGRLDEARVPAWAHAVADMRQQLARLLQPGFLGATEWDRLRCFPRYLRAMLKRLEKLRTVGPARDAEWTREVRAWWARHDERREKHEIDGTDDPELDRFRWMIEELRVSLFAQELGTSEPVSPKRMQKQWDRVRP